MPPRPQGPSSGEQQGGWRQDKLSTSDIKAKSSLLEAVNGEKYSNASTKNVLTGGFY